MDLLASVQVFILLTCSVIAAVVVIFEFYGPRYAKAITEVLDQLSELMVRIEIQQCPQAKLTNFTRVCRLSSGLLTQAFLHSLHLLG